MEAFSVLRSRSRMSSVSLEDDDRREPNISRQKAYFRLALDLKVTKETIERLLITILSSHRLGGIAQRRHGNERSSVGNSSDVHHQETASHGLGYLRRPADSTGRPGRARCRKDTFRLRTGVCLIRPRELLVGVCIALVGRLGE